MGRIDEVAYPFRALQAEIIIDGLCGGTRAYAVLWDLHQVFEYGSHSDVSRSSVDDGYTTID